MEGVKEIMTQKMFTKYLPAQAEKMEEGRKIPVVKIEIGGNEKVIIRIPYNQELIRKIKTISGRRWDPKRKYWEVPIVKG